MFYSTISNDISSPPPTLPSAPPLPPQVVSMATFSSVDDHHHAHTTPTAIAPTKTCANETDSNLLPHHHSPVPWSTGLCDCCHDPCTCCLTCCCPCITFGRIAEIVDRGSTSCGISGGLYMLIMLMTGCSCLYSCFYRAKLRGQYFLKERPCSDCCVHCCFEPCALCQEYRQLKNLGFDMSIGWHGNMERRKGVVSMPPSVKNEMKR